MEALLIQSSVIPQPAVAVYEALVAQLGSDDVLSSSTLPETLLQYSASLRLPRSVKSNFLPRGLYQTACCATTPNLKMMVASSLLYSLIQPALSPIRIPATVSMADPNLNELFHGHPDSALLKLASVAATFTTVCRNAGTMAGCSVEDFDAAAQRLVDALAAVVPTLPPLTDIEHVVIAAIERVAATASPPEDPQDASVTALGSLLSCKVGTVHRALLAALLRECTEVATCFITITCFFAACSVAAPTAPGARPNQARVKSAVALVDRLEALLRAQSPRCADLAVRQFAFDLAVYIPQRAAAMELKGSPIAQIACDHGQPRLSYEAVWRDPLATAGGDAGDINAVLGDIMSLDVTEMPMEAVDPYAAFFESAAAGRDDAADANCDGVWGEVAEGVEFKLESGPFDDFMQHPSNATADLVQLQLFTTNAPPVPENPLAFVRPYLERFKINLND